MAHKKVMKIPVDKWYPFFNSGTGKEEEILNEIVGNKVVIQVADIVANPKLAERNFSSYHEDLSISKEGESLYHFTEYNCCYDTVNFKSHVCLCIHKGEVSWHKPGKCKHYPY